MTLNEHLRIHVRAYLLDTLDQTNWNVAEAAKLAGCHRTQFYKLMSKHEIAPKQPRQIGNEIWQELRH